MDQVVVEGGVGERRMRLWQWGVFGESGHWRVWDVGRRGGAWRERRKLLLRF